MGIWAKFFGCVICKSSPRDITSIQRTEVNLANPRDTSRTSHQTTSFTTINNHNDTSYIANSNKGQELKRFIKIKSTVQIQDIMISNFKPIGKSELRYNCPICFRYFNRMLKSECCNNYICHYCCKDINDCIANDQLKIPRCSFCNQEDFTVVDVELTEKIRHYTDSPYTPSIASKNNSVIKNRLNIPHRDLTNDFKQAEMNSPNGVRSPNHPNRNNNNDPNGEDPNNKIDLTNSQLIDNTNLINLHSAIEYSFMEHTMNVHDDARNNDFDENQLRIILRPIENDHENNNDNNNNHYHQTRYNKDSPFDLVLDPNDVNIDHEENKVNEHNRISLFNDRDNNNDHDHDHNHANADDDYGFEGLIEIIKDQELEIPSRQDPHLSEEIQKHRMGNNIDIPIAQN